MDSEYDTRLVGATTDAEDELSTLGEEGEPKGTAITLLPVTNSAGSRGEGPWACIVGVSEYEL